MGKFTVFYVASGHHNEYLDSGVTFIVSVSENIDTLMPIAEKAISSCAEDEDAIRYRIIITKEDKKRIHSYTVRMRCVNKSITYIDMDNEDVIRWW